MIPALPFAYLLGGLALAELFEKRLVWGRYVAAGLCLWVVVEAMGIYPGPSVVLQRIGLLAGIARTGSVGMAVRAAVLYGWTTATSTGDKVSNNCARGWGFTPTGGR